MTDSNDEIVRELYQVKERVSVLETITQALSKKLDSIDGHLAKIVWLIVAGIAMAAIQFVIKGGLG